MTWRISLSEEALRFLERNRNSISSEEIFDLIRKAIEKFKGEAININIRKLKGEWADFYRIRRGRVRVILAFDFEDCSVFVAVIDWRGDVYR